MTGWQPQQYDPYEHQRRIRQRAQQPPQQQPPPPQPPWQEYPPQQPDPRQQSGYAPPPQEPRQGRKSRLPLWGSIAALVVLAGGGAAYALAGHGSDAAKPQTCQQQYTNWRHGPAHRLAQGIKTDGTALTAAGKSEDLLAMAAALKKVGDDAAGLEAYPMPACADPHGYYTQMLADFKAAGDNAASSSGLGGLLLAMGPAKNAETLGSKIDAELKARHISTTS